MRLNGNRRGIGAAAAAVVLAGCATGGPTGSSMGQAEPMVTDRPDFTESAVTVSPGQMQAEGGYTLTSVDGATIHTLGELLVRTGLGPLTELRVGVGSYAWIDPDVGAGVSDLTGTFAGFKVRLPAGGLADQLALLGATTLPIETDLYDPGWTPSVILAAAWEAGPGGLGANLGYTHTEESDSREVLGSLSYGFPVVEAIGGFVEVFGQIPRGATLRASADAGLTWPLTPDLQLDLRVVRSLRGPEATAFGIGIARRF